MRISDWSSDVCSSDLGEAQHRDRQSGVAHLVRSRHARAQQRRDRAQFRGPAEGVALGLDRPAVALRKERRSEERREGKRVSVRVDLGGRRFIKNKHTIVTKYSLSLFLRISNLYMCIMY